MLDAHSVIDGFYQVPVRWSHEIEKYSYHGS